MSPVTRTWAPRVLDDEPVPDLAAYRRQGGMEALAAARAVDPVDVVDVVAASGLRGRGGAGFPTGVKWRTVREHAAPELPTSVVVNAAEGEPGTFKDRLLLRRNPYRVLEGALVAAHAVDADLVVVATKAAFTAERDRIERAVVELDDRGDAGGVAVRVIAGPDAYLYGEETALLEVVDGRHPFPRVAPPYRHGVDELVTAGAAADVAGAGGLTLAAPGDATAAPPSLVNNTETLANVPGIVLHGPAWFRERGTDAAPGTIVCTVSGRTRRHGVDEVPLGTPLGEVIERIGGGPRRGRRLVAAMSGVANRLLPADAFDTPVTYEDLAAAGSGLGAAGFIVFDDETDPASVAAGVSRFLAVESCGQCRPCKADGLAIASHLERIRRSSATEQDLAVVSERLATITEGARCALAQQHQDVITSVFDLFDEQLVAHVAGAVPAAAPELVAPIVDLVDDRFVLDDGFTARQPDWSYDRVDSGKAPVDRLGHAP